MKQELVYFISIDTDIIGILFTFNIQQARSPTLDYNLVRAR